MRRSDGRFWGRSEGLDKGCEWLGGISHSGWVNCFAELLDNRLALDDGGRVLRAVGPLEEYGLAAEARSVNEEDVGAYLGFSMLEVSANHFLPAKE